MGNTRVNDSEKRVVASFTIQQWVKDSVRIKCAAQNVSASNLINEFLIDWLNENG